MKTKILLVFLLGILATTGSTCINDGFLVAVNLPIEACVDINSGPNLIFAGSQMITLGDQIDVSYQNNIKSARFYDVRVSTKGTYNGTLYIEGKIDGVNLVKTKTNPWPWADFATPQSLLGKSEKFTVDSLGLQQLVLKLNQLKTNPNTTVTLSASGVLSGQSPVPSGLSVCLEILAQVDAEVK
jgi:hypothetical protein